MQLAPFPHDSRIRWRRLDVHGHENAHIRRAASGWHVSGDLEVDENGSAFRLRYVIECDSSWCARSAYVDGEMGDSAMSFTLTTDGNGAWMEAGASLPLLLGALDLDLGFTPSTNMLAILRLGLGVGDSVPVRSAWLRFPELRLEPLEQTYTRQEAQVFRYRSLIDGVPYVARLDTDAYGRVLRYENLWVAELPTD